VDSQLQPDPSDETHALLRILIYKMDNTTFGSNVPTVPQWTGPPRAIVHVQAILFASLVVSLFSAFLAMLGKQWLNRYDSADIRGSVVERSQNRQRKLDGIIVWYFNNVMELLPLMLQAALLLFGCALSRYLWEVNRTIASVVLGVTSFGALSYLFIVIAGAVFESCPYQTPGAHILRHHVLPVLRLISSKFKASYPALRLIPSKFKASYCYREPILWWKDLEEPWYSISNFTYRPLFLLLTLLIALVLDVYCLGRTILRLLVTFNRTVILRPLVVFGRTVHHRFTTNPLRTRDLGQQTIISDLQCISWVFQMSLDKAFHLSALKYLAAMPELAYFDPTLVISCFSIFASCVNAIGCELMVVEGSQQLAMVSAGCVLRTLRHLSLTDPTSNTLADLHRHYNSVFPPDSVRFDSLPSHYMMFALHILFRYVEPTGWLMLWHNNRPSTQEHIQLAWCIAEAARVEYRRRMPEKIPPWMLGFVLDSLSQDPPPPPSAVSDCLKVIAIGLGCDFPIIGTADDRCVEILQIATFLTKN
jgi:hypothetical protein